MYNETNNQNKFDGKSSDTLRQALLEYRSGAKQKLIKSIRAKNDSEYNTYRFMIEYGPRTKFENLLDFFVNLPSIQKELNDEKLMIDWKWNRVEPNSFSKEFYYRPEVVAKLRENAGTDALFNEGWRVKYADGRIDGETTWSEASYLLVTNSYYAFIDLYTEQDH